MAARRDCNSEIVLRDTTPKSRSEFEISLSSCSGYIVEIAVSKAATVWPEASTRS